MGTCRKCKSKGVTISDTIGFCAHCIRDGFEEVRPEIEAVHHRSRRAYGLPPEPPRFHEGTPCPLCFQECRIPEGGRGYCGLRRVEDGRLLGGRPHEGNLSYYYDPLPTNCVGDWVCPGGTDCGYPQYSVYEGPEKGYRNLAVFYHACSFNCLYCQNYHFREHSASLTRIPAKDLARAVGEKTTCICYFGGDPTPQVLHALKASRLALRNAKGHVLRICWETNGSAREPFLSGMAELSLESGGCVKVDLKAWDEGIHRTLCGVSNRRTLENFRSLSAGTGLRPEPPFLIASTLLVPGYVDEREVEKIAAFIAQLDPKIPYSLLGFYPHFYLRDLPTTSLDHALRCEAVAKRAGLRRVHLGNAHLLGDAY
jgi:pyruvate formate lyase activating enzyme